MTDEAPKSRALGKPKEMAVSYPSQPGTAIQIQREDPYAGAASKPVTREQAVILCSAIEPSEVKILPDSGIAYLDWEWYAHRLTAAFGPMGWTLLPVLDREGQPVPPKAENNVMYREYVLRADGRFVASAIGECAYRENNKRMTWGDCAEGARSNALSRCCKSLGMAHDIYSDAWRDKWRAENCVAVNAPDYQGRLSVNWRRADGHPIRGEQGHANPPCPCDACAKGQKNMAADGKIMPSAPVIDTSNTTNPLITKAQGQLLHIKAKANGWTEEQFKVRLAEKYKVTSTLDLTLDAFNDAIDFFRTTKP